MSIAMKDDTEDAKEDPGAQKPKPLPRLVAVVDRDALDLALKDVMVAHSARLTLPILGNIRLMRDEHRLYLSATNLEIAATRVIEIAPSPDPLTHGSVCLPAKKLTQFVAGLKKGDAVALTQTAENAMQLNAKRSRSRTYMVGMPSAEFPTVPTSRTADEEMIDHDLAHWNRYEQAPTRDEAIARTRRFWVPVAQLREACRQVAYCTSSDDMRAIFNGANLRLEDDDRVTFCGADSFRLGVYSFQGEDLPKPEELPDIIIPRPTLLALYKLLGRIRHGSVELIVPGTRKQLILAFEGGTLLTNLVYGTYPDFDHVLKISEEHSVFADVQTDDLRDAIKRSMQFAYEPGDKGVIMRVKITRDGVMTLLAEDDEEGKTEQDLDVVLKYDPHPGDPKAMPPVVGFIVNGVYLRDFAAVCPTSRIRFAMVAQEASDRQVTLTPIPNDDEKLGYTLSYIVMPMHSTR